MLSRLMESICVVPQLILGPVGQGERNPEALKRIVLKKNCSTSPCRYGDVSLHARMIFAVVFNRSGFNHSRIRARRLDISALEFFSKSSSWGHRVLDIRLVDPSHFLSRFDGHICWIKSKELTGPVSHDCDGLSSVHISWAACQKRYLEGK